MIKQIVILGFLIFGTYQVQAADLLEYFEAAAARDPVYGESQKSYDMSLEGIPQAKSLNRVQVNLTGGIKYNVTDNSANSSTAGFGNSNIGAQNYETYSAGVVMTKALRNLENRVVLKQADLRIQQSEFLVRNSLQGLILRTSQAYVDVILAEHQFATAVALKRATVEQLQIAKERFESGLSSIVDVKNAQAKTDLVHGQEVLTKAELEIKKKQLAQASGLQVAELPLFNLQKELNPPDPNNADSWMRDAGNHPLVKSARLDESLANAELEKTKMAGKLRIEAVASVSYDRTFSTHGPVASAGIQFVKPLGTGGRISSTQRQAASGIARAALAAQATLDNQTLEAFQSFQNISAAQMQIKSLQQALASTQMSYDSTQEGFKSGTRTINDVIIALQEVYQTQKDLAAAYAKAYMFDLKLKASVGALTVQDLRELSQHLSN